MSMKKSRKKATTLYVVLVALMAAVTFVITFFVPVPIGPVGYVNFGDAVIFLSACRGRRSRRWRVEFLR